MEVTASTWFVAIAGLLLILLLGALQFVAVIRPRSDWTAQNVIPPTVSLPDGQIVIPGVRTRSRRMIGLGRPDDLSGRVDAAGP